MLRPEDIELYPMNLDVQGKRTHGEYVDDMASWLVREMIGYRITPPNMIKLVQYADENWERLNA